MAHGRRRRGRCTVLRLSDCIIVVVSMMATLAIVGLLASAASTGDAVAANSTIAADGASYLACVDLALAPLAPALATALGLLSGVAPITRTVFDWAQATAVAGALPGAAGTARGYVEVLGAGGARRAAWAARMSAEYGVAVTPGASCGDGDGVLVMSYCVEGSGSGGGGGGGGASTCHPPLFECLDPASPAAAAANGALASGEARGALLPEAPDGGGGGGAGYTIYGPVGGAANFSTCRALLIASVDIGGVLARASAAGQFDDLAVSVADVTAGDPAAPVVVYSAGAPAGPVSLIQPVMGQQLRPRTKCVTESAAPRRPTHQVIGVRSVLGRNLTITATPDTAFVDAYTSARAESTALLMTLFPVRALLLRARARAGPLVRACARALGLRARRGVPRVAHTECLPSQHLMILLVRCSQLAVGSALLALLYSQRRHAASEQEAEIAAAKRTHSAVMQYICHELRSGRGLRARGRICALCNASCSRAATHCTARWARSIDSSRWVPRCRRRRVCPRMCVRVPTSSQVAKSSSSDSGNAQGSTSATNSSSQGAGHHGSGGGSGGHRSAGGAAVTVPAPVSEASDTEAAGGASSAGGGSGAPDHAAAAVASGGGASGGSGSWTYGQGHGSDDAADTDALSEGTDSVSHAHLAVVKGHLRRMHVVLNAVLKTQLLLGGAAAEQARMTVVLVQDLLRDVAQVRRAAAGENAGSARCDAHHAPTLDLSHTHISYWYSQPRARARARRAAQPDAPRGWGVALRAHARGPWRRARGQRAARDAARDGRPVHLRSRRVRVRRHRGGARRARLARRGRGSIHGHLHEPERRLRGSAIQFTAGVVGRGVRRRRVAVDWRPRGGGVVAAAAAAAPR